MLRIAPYLYLPVTDMPGDFEVSFYAVVRGFHVYQAIWTPTVGEALATQREHAVIPKMLMQWPLCSICHVLIISASFNISDWRLALYLEQKKYDTMPSGA